MENNKKSLKVNAFLNIIKQVCSILFPMITFPYASRVLGKYSYGKINFSQSIISYITLIAGLGITNYAIREGAKIRNNKVKLNKFANEVFSINVISTLIAYIVLFILILSWERLNGYALLLIIQSLSIIFTTIGTDWINSIYEDYFYITVRYIICQTLAVILMISLVKGEDDYLIYALTSVSSTILANIMNVSYIRKKYQIKIHFTFNLNLQKHLYPILILFGTSVASLIYINSDVTILGILKDENEVGLYSVSAKIYSLVKNLLNAMLVVAIPRISHEIATEKKSLVNDHLSDILSDLLIIIAPACIGLFILSKSIVLLFSGNAFIQSASSLQILSLSLIFATIACFFINVVMIPFGLEKNVLFATVLSAMVNIILNFILIPKWGQNAAAFTTLISEFIMMLLGIIFSKKLIRLNVKRSLLVGSLNGLLTFFSCSISLKLITNNFIIILLSVIMSVILCVFNVFLLYREKFNEMTQFLHKKVNIRS